MRVAIIEIMETGHVTMAESLARIFCSHQGNNVVIFTLGSHAKNLNHLCELYPGLSISIKTQDRSIGNFLGEIAAAGFDRVYVVTMTKFFPEFAQWKLKSPLHLIVHNLDEWFSLSLPSNISKFISGILKKPDLKLILFLIKLHFLIPRHKKKILNIVSLTKGCVVVLSEAVKEQAVKFKENLNIEVVPFSVYDPVLEKDDSNVSEPLTICIPGIVSQYRRNYIALLDMAEKQLGEYKDDFLIDFLGGIQPDNRLNDSAPVIEKAHDLKLKGFNIRIHETSFIPAEEYDNELARADIILGNMNVVLNRHSRYGRTKETGIPFAMIKAAKPGILPHNYPVPDEIKSSTVRYESYDHLGKILIGFINDRQSLIGLQKTALENSRLFSPEMIYKQITAGDRLHD